MDWRTPSSAMPSGVCRGPRQSSVLTGASCARGSCTATDPEVCMGLRHWSGLPADESGGRAGCRATDPEVCSGLRHASDLADDASGVRPDWEGTDPEVCKGLRQASFLGLDESISAPMVNLLIDTNRHQSNNHRNKPSPSSPRRGANPCHYPIPGNSLIASASDSILRRNGTQRGSEWKGSSTGFTAAVARNAKPESRARSSSANPRSSSPNTP